MEPFDGDVEALLRSKQVSLHNKRNAIAVETLLAVRSLVPFHLDDAVRAGHRAELAGNAAVLVEGKGTLASRWKVGLYLGVFLRDLGHEEPLRRNEEPLDDSDSVHG